MHIEFLLEEPSTEAFLEGFLPRFLPLDTTWRLIVFRGKRDLLAKLSKRLQGYRQWLSPETRLIVLVDEDRQDCRLLKERLEQAAQSAGLRTKSTAQSGELFVVVNRIIVEELEAWFFGDVDSLIREFPCVISTLGNRARYRDPDAISGGTWEALEHVLQNAGHYPAGLSKIDLARRLGRVLDATRNRSRSFGSFLEALRAVTS